MLFYYLLNVFRDMASCRKWISTKPNHEEKKSDKELIDTPKWITQERIILLQR